MEVLGGIRVVAVLHTLHILDFVKQCIARAGEKHTANEEADIGIERALPRATEAARSFL